MSTTNRLHDGQIFARYEIVRLLGQGGMGAVYEAVHPILKKRFALKTLLPTLAQTADVRARFLREGEAASRINHPNVVDISDVGIENDTPYMVMEFLEGETLAELLERRGRLDVSEALDFLLPVISAVIAGHDKGVVHRDLKPQNVFLARGHWGESIPKLLDFGVSKLTGGDNAALTGRLTILGTAAYMSPEQAQGSPLVDGQSDQYAVGLVLYEALTGARAHQGSTAGEVMRNIASGAVVPAQAIRPDLPEALTVSLGRMLAAASTDRFPSLRAAGRALLPFASARTRMAIPDSFQDSPNPGPAEPARGGALNRTQVLPRGPASVPSPVPSPPLDRTQMLPQPTKQPNTTFSRTAAEVTASRPDGRSPQRFPWLVAGLAIAAPAALVWALTGRSRPPVVEPPPPAAAVHEATETVPAVRPLTLRAEPAGAEIRLDDLAPVRGRLDRAITDDDARHTIRVTAPGHEPVTIVLGPHEAPPPEIRLRPSPPLSPQRQAPPRHKRRSAKSGKLVPGMNGVPIIE